MLVRRDRGLSRGISSGVYILGYSIGVLRGARRVYFRLWDGCVGGGNQGVSRAISLVG